MKAKDIQPRRLVVGSLVLMFGTFYIAALPANADEGKRYYDKSNSFHRESVAAAKIKDDNIQFKRLTSEYAEAVKQSGENSAGAFSSGRSLAEYCLERNQLDKAQPILVKLVEHARDPKNYFDAGAEWDERRRKGEPTEGSEKMMLYGKEVTVTVLDNRRPSGKFNRADLVRFLYVLSSINSKPGQPKLAAAEMDEAKQNYSKYQLEKPALLLASFESFIAKYSRGSSVGTPL